MDLCPPKLAAISSASAVHCSEGASKDPQARLSTGETLRPIAPVLQVDRPSSSRFDNPELCGKDRDRREPLASGFGSSNSTNVFRTTLATLQLEKSIQRPGSYFGAGGRALLPATLDHAGSCTGQPTGKYTESSTCQKSDTKLPGGIGPKEAGSMHRGVQHGDSVSVGVGDTSSSLSSSRTAQRLMLHKSRGNDLQRLLAAITEPGACQNALLLVE